MKANRFSLPAALALMLASPVRSQTPPTPSAVQEPSTPQARAFAAYMKAERVWANPFKAIRERMAEIEREREAAKARQAEEERRRREAVQAYLEEEWIAVDPQGFIKRQSQLISGLQGQLARQSEEIARLLKLREDETQQESKKGADLKKNIDELRGLIQDQQKKLEEQKTVLKKENADLKKSLDTAQNDRKAIQKSTQHVINLIRERILRDFETQVFDGVEFVKIPAGSFMMGTTPEEVEELTRRGLWSRLNGCETPAHRITISRPFFISKCEITQAQWKSVMEKNPSAFSGDALPVESVGWNDVETFLKRLSDKSGGDYRLPTEAEWEYCARAGGDGLFGLAQGGEAITLETLDRYGWITSNSENKTHPVAAKAPNAWGLYDMLGNVWEWCLDWHHCDFYTGSPEKDPRAEAEGTERVFRGGAWALEPQHARAAIRGGNLPGFKSPYVGFRVAREIKNP